MTKPNPQLVEKVVDALEAVQLNNGPVTLRHFIPESAIEELARAAISSLQDDDVVDALREALEPFARDFIEAGVPDNIPDDTRFGDVDCDGSQLTVGEFRRAREVLSKAHRSLGGK